MEHILQFGIFIINLRIYWVKECALSMVLLSRLFLHLTDLTPMQRFYIVVGVLAGVVFLQFLVIIVIMRFTSKRSHSTKEPEIINSNPKKEPETINPYPKIEPEIINPNPTEDSENINPKSAELSNSYSYDNKGQDSTNF